MKDSFLKTLKDLDLFSKEDKLIFNKWWADSVSSMFVKRYWL